MNLFSYFTKRKPISTARKCVNRKARLGMEALEDRCVPAVSSFGRTPIVAPPPTPTAVGLLVPAVQRLTDDSAASAGGINKLGSRLLNLGGTSAGLLLPAIQKVREAAARAIPAAGGNSYRGVTYVGTSANASPFGGFTVTVNQTATNGHVKVFDGATGLTATQTTTSGHVKVFDGRIDLTVDQTATGGHVKVFDGLTGSEVSASFYGTGVYKIEVSNQAQSNPHVKVFSGGTTVEVTTSFYGTGVYKIAVSNQGAGSNVYTISFGGSTTGTAQALNSLSTIGGTSFNPAQTTGSDLLRVGTGELFHKEGRGHLILPGSTGFNLTKELTGTLIPAASGSLSSTDNSPAIIAVLIGM